MQIVTLKEFAVTMVRGLSVVAGLGGKTILEHPAAGVEATKTCMRRIISLRRDEYKIKTIFT